VILLWWWARQKKISKKLRYWVHPINLSNICSSTSVVANELHSDPDKFKTFYRMSKSNFDNLVHIVGPKIFKRYKLQDCSTSTRKNFTYITVITYITTNLLFEK